MQRFTMFHWDRLHRLDPTFPEPTLRLSPWPDGIPNDRELDDDLTRWQILSDTGNIDDSTRALFTDLTVPQEAMWGVIWRTTAVTTAQFALPAEAEQWGIDSAPAITPCYPFLITRNDQRVYACLSTSSALQFAHYPATHHADKDFGLALHDICDPNDDWKADPLTRTDLPLELLADAGSNPDTSSWPIQGSTRKKLRTLLKKQPHTLVQLLTARDSATPPTESPHPGGLVFTTDHTVMAGWPATQAGRDVFTYTGADKDTYRQLAAAMFKTC